MLFFHSNVNDSNVLLVLEYVLLVNTKTTSENVNLGWSIIQPWNAAGHGFSLPRLIHTTDMELLDKIAKKGPMT